MNVEAATGVFVWNRMPNIGETLIVLVGTTAALSCLAEGQTMARTAETALEVRTWSSHKDQKGH